MSRIGNSPVKLPSKVEVTLAGGEISIKGPLGSLKRTFGSEVTIEKDGDTLTFKAANADANAMHGTVRALVAGMVFSLGTSIIWASWGASAARAWCSRDLTAPTETPSSPATSLWLRPCR